MKTNDPSEIKSVVREKYGAIAVSSSSCCGPTNCCGDGTINVSPNEYTQLDGYVKDADLGLGCGLPTMFAKIRQGETVVDLGSGAGNDVFVARRIVGDNGHVVGVDMTPAMIEKANQNNAGLGYKNVEFRLGEIEQLPVDENFADLVISNCVLNLVPDKQKAFSEIARVLKPGGRFSISDLVLTGPLPESVRTATALYIGCIAGATTTDAYMTYIAKAGLTNVVIASSKKVDLPEEVLRNYATEAEIREFAGSGTEVLSITVTGFKPGK